MADQYKQVPRGLLSRPLFSMGLSLLDHSNPQPGVRATPWRGIREGLMSSNVARQQEIEQYRAAQEAERQRRQFEIEQKQREQDLFNVYRQRAEAEARKDYINRYIESGGQGDITLPDGSTITPDQALARGVGADEWGKKQLEVLSRKPDDPTVMLKNKQTGQTRLFTPQEAGAAFNTGQWEIAEKPLTELQKRDLAIRESQEAREATKFSIAQAQEAKEAYLASQDEVGGLEAAAQNLEAALTAMDEAYDISDDSFATGAMRNVTRMSGFTEGSDRELMDGYIDTMSGVVAIDALLKIKAQGATLGQITEKELNMLKSRLGNIRPSNVKKWIEQNRPLFEKMQREMIYQRNLLKQGLPTLKAATQGADSEANAQKRYRYNPSTGTVE